MDAVSDPATWQIVFMKSSQVGGTEALLNTIGYHMDYDPAPILCIQPNLTPMAQDFSKDRVDPLIRDTPTLRGKVSEAKSRDGDNSLLHKKFSGGHLTITGANAPAGLASRPIRIILADEVDRWPASAGKEGDPLLLATKRTQTFWNRKVLIVSTPTVKGLSRVAAAFEETDKRRYYIPCPRCSAPHVLTWSNVRWGQDTPANGDPGKAMLQCPECQGFYSNHEKNVAVSKGKWKASEKFAGRAGFWINEIYSPWSSVGDMAKTFLEVKANPERLQVFVNTSLAEEWEGDGEIVDDTDLLSRCENYPAEIPARALMLTCGADVQPDRIEAEVVGWGAGEESWSIDYAVFHGDPDIPENQAGSPWRDFMDWAKSPRKHETGAEMTTAFTCIDSGGSNTQAVYQFVKRHAGERVFAIKGRGGEGVPIVGNPQAKRSGFAKRPVRVYIVGVDQAKLAVFNRLRITDPGPGYCHFPKGREPGYFRQLTAEKLVTKHVKGRAVREWVLVAGRRNEALDCRVYALAAMLLASPQFDKLAYRLKQWKLTHTPAEAQSVAIADTGEDSAPLAEEPATPTPAAPRPSRGFVRRPMRPGGFVRGWK